MAIDAKQLGNQPAAPFSAYEEEVKIRPTQHAGFNKREDIAKTLAAGMVAGSSVWPDDGDWKEIARRAVTGTDALLAELAGGAA